MLPDRILDKAFRRAEQNARSIKDLNKIIQAKKRELVRIETVKNIVVSEIDKLIIKIPKERELQSFYRELLEISFEWKEIKRALIRLKFVRKFVIDLYTKYKNSIKISRDFQKMKALRKEYYGRVASLLKRNRIYFDLLNEVMEFYKKVPNIKACPTVVIAGYPNVGKSTLLYKLTGSKPDIQPYPFTTKDIMLGYIKTPYFNIQLIDTPGILDRPLEEMNKIEKKAVLAIRNLPHLIIYVIDATESCGYDIESQIKLLNQIERNFKKDVWIYLSKTDLFEKEDVKRVEKVKTLGKPVYNEVKKLRDDLINYFKKRKELYL